MESIIYIILFWAFIALIQYVWEKIKENREKRKQEELDNYTKQEFKNFDYLKEKNEIEQLIKPLIPNEVIERYENYFCPKCSKKLVIREGKFGKFIGCSNYPNCNYSKSL